MQQAFTLKLQLLTFTKDLIALSTLLHSSPSYSLLHHYINSSSPPNTITLSELIFSPPLLQTLTEYPPEIPSSYPFSLFLLIHLYTSWRGGVVGSIVGCSGAPRLCYSCFTWMYLECIRGFTCPPSLWWYWLLGLSSVSGVLASWFHPGWLLPVSYWGIGRLS